MPSTQVNDTALSERLSASTVEEARPLLEELLWAVEGEPISHLISDRGNKYLNLLDIGPEGYLSAVAMLFPDGWNLELRLDEDGAFVSIYQLGDACDGPDGPGNIISKSYKGKHEHPDLALAAAIAKTLEIE